jgi:hypothetical protein
MRLLGQNLKEANEGLYGWSKMLVGWYKLWQIEATRKQNSLRQGLLVCLLSVGTFRGGG